MANWKHRIQLNEVLEKVNDEYDLSEFERPCPAKVKAMLAAEVEKAPPLRGFAPVIQKAKTIAELNRVLARVFDVADEQLVWCGGM